jgi:DNA-binding NarL/FixJ family response regulator
VTARVLAVDDQSVFLAIMRELVDAADGLETVAEAGSAERAIELAREIEPDLVLMDVWMSGTDGIAAARAIKARRPETVVVLTSTTHPDDLPLAGEDEVADAVIWKSHLEPRLLVDIWSRSRDQGTSPSS